MLNVDHDSAEGNKKKKGLLSISSRFLFMAVYVHSWVGSFIVVTKWEERFVFHFVLTF